jgi:hypothetical protein
LAKGLTGAVLPLSKAIEGEVESMKLPPLVVCLTAIGFFALSPRLEELLPVVGDPTAAVGDFMAALLVGDSVWEGTQQRALIFFRGIRIRSRTRISSWALRVGRGNDIAFLRHDDGRFRDATLDTMGISDITTTVSFAIIAIFSTILISLRLVSLIGGTLTTDTSTTDIPTSMRIMIPHRFTMTSIGKIWR